MLSEPPATVTLIRVDVGIYCAHVNGNVQKRADGRPACKPFADWVAICNVAGLEIRHVKDGMAI